MNQLYPVLLPKEEGYLQVSKLHKIFYATYGNPNGTPAIVLHGGPGAGCSDVYTSFFDLNKWHVIMLDQRGAHRSKPFACMEENTTDHCIEDIEVLRTYLKIKQWVVFGGSWGSLLGILYGKAHPESCLGFILRGIFLGREQDFQHLLYQMGKKFPEPYKEFLTHFDQEEKKDLVTAGYKRIMDPDLQVAIEFAQAFFSYLVHAKLPEQTPEDIEEGLKDHVTVYGKGKAFFHYSYHKFFLTPNQTLQNFDAISRFSAIIVHGAEDAICLPQQAHLLHEHWKNSFLWMVKKGGHSFEDLRVGSALARATDKFLEL